jgi:hypothetical protein
MLHADIDEPTVEVRFERWLDLDRLSVQFWESRSIRPGLIPVAKPDAGDQMRYLWPEIMERGVINLVEYQVLSEIHLNERYDGGPYSASFSRLPQLKTLVGHG